MFVKLYLYPVAQRYYSTRRRRELNPHHWPYFTGKYGWGNGDNPRAYRPARHGTNFRFAY